MSAGEEDREPRVAVERLGSLDQLVGRRFQSRRIGKDRVVNVEQRLAADVLQGRQLVHPPSVVPLVVVGVVRGGPACEHQGRFCLRQTVLRHEHVDIGKRPAERSGQARQQVGSAFQQDQGKRERSKGVGDVRHLTPHFLLLSACQGAACKEMRCWPGRNAREQSALVEQGGYARQQPGTSSLPDKTFPGGSAELANAVRVAER
jgi:hypothetical protein